MHKEGFFHLSFTYCCVTFRYPGPPNLMFSVHWGWTSCLPQKLNSLQGVIFQLLMRHKGTMIKVVTSLRMIKINLLF